MGFFIGQAQMFITNPMTIMDLAEKLAAMLKYNF